MEFVSKDLRQGTVSCAIWHNVFWGESISADEMLTIMRASGCRCRTEKEESFSFATPFYILLWSQHQATNRSTIWKAMDVIPTVIKNIKSLLFCYSLLWNKLMWRCINNYPRTRHNFKAHVSSNSTLTLRDRHLGHCPL